MLSRASMSFYPHLFSKSICSLFLSLMIFKVFFLFSIYPCCFPQIHPWRGFWEASWEVWCQTRRCFYRDVHQYGREGNGSGYCHVEQTGRRCDWPSAAAAAQKLPRPKSWLCLRFHLHSCHREGYEVPRISLHVSHDRWSASHSCGCVICWRVCVGQSSNDAYGTRKAPSAALLVSITTAERPDGGSREHKWR